MTALIRTDVFIKVLIVFVSLQLVPASPLWLLAAGPGGGWQTGSLICTFLPLDTFNFLQMPATPATICIIFTYQDIRIHYVDI